MKNPTEAQLKAAYARGKRDALNGEHGAPTPYDIPALGMAWMAGYDSTDPKDCAPFLGKEDDEFWVQP